jgi:hypothetical protein
VVSVERDGKQRIYRLNPTSLTEMSGWAERLCRTWEARFDALGEHLDRMKAGEERVHEDG